MKPHYLFTLLPFLLAFSLGAQAAPWYRVEVILVLYQDEKLINKETWPESLPAAEVTANDIDFNWWLYPSITKNTALLGNFGFAKEPNANWAAPMQYLPNLQLMDAAKRIQARKDMKVIWHKAWIEPIQEQGNAIVHPLDIRLADKIDFQLTGSFSLYRSRFLHMTTDFIMQHNEPMVLAELDALPPDTSSDDRSDLVTHAALESLEEEIVIMPIRAAHIKQSRRMRSGELHYIDHPFMGIIVKATPITDAASM